MCQLFRNVRIDSMWFITTILLLQSVIFIDAEFGVPYLKKSRLCHPWDCVAKNLGLPKTLPPQRDYERILKSLLLQDWHQAVEKAVDTCYNNRTREYTNTCTGQALLQCTLDNLIENCPKNSINRNDACNPVASTAGMNYMFTQSRYKDLEQNLPKERRPAWFMRQYFDTNCCAVPDLVNATVLSECGFRTFLRYYENEPKTKEEGTKYYMVKQKLNKETKEKKGKMFAPTGRLEELYEDPFECCDMEDFVSSSWVSECDFKLSWDISGRFRIGDQNERVSTTVTPERNTGTLVNRDIRIVPLSCSKETCIFKKLNVISESGAVDINAFSKVLDSFTASHPSWSKAQARVITQCLTKQTSDYRADCKINELLGCVLDVFSENCPHKSKDDICRDSRRNNTICQISASKYRPKHRRSVCGLPHLVDSDILTECGVNSVSQIEYVTETAAPKRKKTWATESACQDSSRSTLCLMNKMGVLNKYDFMDYFRMKDRIRSFTAGNPEWGALTELYMNVFTALPLYDDLCNTPKKLLNVFDAMVITCPMPKRKNSPQCKKLFDDVIVSPSKFRNITKERLDEILQNLHDTFSSSTNPTSTTPIEIVTKPVFDYGILRSRNAPVDRTIDIEEESKILHVKKPSTKAPLVLLPVYMRMNSSLLQTAQTLGPKNGVFQNPPFKLHRKANSTDRITWKPYFII